MGFKKSEVWHPADRLSGQISVRNPNRFLFHARSDGIPCANGSESYAAWCKFAWRRFRYSPGKWLLQILRQTIRAKQLKIIKKKDPHIFNEF